MMPAMLSTSAVLALLVASSSLASAANRTHVRPSQPPPGSTRRSWTIGQSVSTTSGILIGHASESRPNVSEYLGIPFAIPPLGDLRFAAPRPYKSTSTINASAFSPDCPSNSFNYDAFYAGLDPETLAALVASLNEPVAANLLGAYGQSGHNHGEDCLTLNVWTKPQIGEQKKAVMVWIYGGGFESGASSNPFYNGVAFADDQDVVLVSMNYRTNVFGFPGLPSTSAAQNAGLLDQRLAIEWVRDNIAAFGGDVNRITLFGQSAGAASVDLYSYAYQKDPIVNALIAESGTATSFFDPAPKNNSVAWFSSSAALGCGNESVGAEASLACVRKVPMEKLLNASAAGNALQSILGNFGPTADNLVVFDNYAERGRNGAFVQVPLLIGNNDYEAGVFRILAASATKNFPDIAWCLFNTYIFSCPARDAASDRIAHSVPTWRYRYFGDFYNLRLTNNPDSGAWHGSEIPLIFGTAEKSSGSPSTAPEEAYTRYLQGAWAAFSKNPEGALYGDWNSGYDWRSYDTPLIPTLIQFATSNTTFQSESYTYASTYDSLCPLLDVVNGLIPGGILNALTSGSINTTELVGLLGKASGAFMMFIAKTNP